MLTSCEIEIWAGGSTADELCYLTLIKHLSLSRESDSDVFLSLRVKKNVLSFFRKYLINKMCKLDILFITWFWW